MDRSSGRVGQRQQSSRDWYLVTRPAAGTIARQTEAWSEGAPGRAGVAKRGSLGSNTGRRSPRIRLQYGTRITRIRLQYGTRIARIRLKYGTRIARVKLQYGTPIARIRLQYGTRITRIRL